ncbi:unnamed protein product, partial [marine sediment metagenome]
PFITPPPEPPPPPSPPPEPPITILKKPKPIKKVPEKVPELLKEGGWNVYGKTIKTGKYKKLNVNSLSYENAQNLGAYLTDHSLSTNFLLKENPNPPKKPKLNIPPNYFRNTIEKWRDYKFKTIKGVRKKYPMKDKWIERTSGARGTAPKGYRLDTRGERNRISLMKKLAELKRRAGLTKVRGLGLKKSQKQINLFRKQQKPKLFKSPKLRKRRTNKIKNTIAIIFIFSIFNIIQILQ